MGVELTRCHSTVGAERSKLRRHDNMTTRNHSVHGSEMSALQEGGIKQKRAREQVEEKRKPTINRKSVIKTRLFIGNVAFMRRRHG